jgi:hypothetical protein
LAYIISDKAYPTNHPIFAFDTNSGSSLLQCTNAPEPHLEIRKPIALCEYSPPITSFWKIFFDGACSKEGASVGVFFISPTQETISLSYKLEFEATNNVAEYEALFLGLRDAKDMGIENISMFGDVELISNRLETFIKPNTLNLGVTEMKYGTSLTNFS